MSKVFFTSDLHLGHRFVAGLRGFDNVDDHDAAIARYWDEAISDDDVVWVLGDIAVSNPSYALGAIGSLPGQKHLIAGNHDKCHPMHRDSHRYQKQYLEVFESVQAFARRKIAGWDVLLSHFPYDTDRETGGPEVVRYTQYRLRKEGPGLWLIHGHTHGQEQLHDQQIHIGLDAWDLKPVPLDTIEKIIVEEEARASKQDP